MLYYGPAVTQVTLTANAHTQPTTAPTTMDYAISIKLSERQYYFLKELAKSEYRTIRNCFSMLAAEGMHYYLADHSVYIDKLPEDCITEQESLHKDSIRQYTDSEVIDTFAGIPLIQ